MKKIFAILLSLLTLLSCGLLSACSAKKTQPDTPDTETVWETVSEAYIYAFPLVLTDATKTLSTNTDGTMTGRAPINQFNHAKKLADASFRTVVTPNVDTVYSQAWLDISTEPMVYVLPETDRFCNVQLLDAWTNTAAVLDKAGAYAIALPGWEGELPDGVTRVDVPTATMWSITRTVLSGNEDLPNVYAIQEQMQLLPLSAYVQGGEYAAPQGAYKEENDFVPVNKVLSMTPAEFFNTANALMQVNPPADADEELLKKLSAINVGAGKTFDRMPEIIDNVIPYIGGEEEKSEQEPLKLWGHIDGDKIVPATAPSITAQCLRVPVSDGHMGAVFVRFQNKPSKEEILQAWKEFHGPAQDLELPSAPKQFLHYFEENDRPQPKLDRMLENGMAVSIGRLREDTQYDYKFVCLSHNTLRGAAGGAVLLAELLAVKGYFD